jgi:hypothetical protein
LIGPSVAHEFFPEALPLVFLLKQLDASVPANRRPWLYRQVAAHLSIYQKS